MDFSKSYKTKFHSLELSNNQFTRHFQYFKSSWLAQQRYLLELFPRGELCPLAIFLNICFPLEKIPFFFLGVSSGTLWVPLIELYFSGESMGDSWNANGTVFAWLFYITKSSRNALMQLLTRILTTTITFQWKALKELYRVLYSKE